MGTNEVEEWKTRYSEAIQNLLNVVEESLHELPQKTRDRVKYALRCVKFEDSLPDRILDGIDKYRETGEFPIEDIDAIYKLALSLGRYSECIEDE
jgi:predicted Zn-dependent protease with MMP-like domain